MDTEPIEPGATERLARAFGATVYDLHARSVEVEVRLLRGLLGVVKVLGLREGEARESRERIRSAIKAAGFRFPERSLLINLAPAELRKVGPGLDLAIACAILAVSDQLPHAAIEHARLWGELSLDGRLRPVRGAIPVALEARRSDARPLVVPEASRSEVSRVAGLPLLAAATLREAVEALVEGGVRIGRTGGSARLRSREDEERAAVFDQVLGQDEAKRALVAAAAGGHHVLLTGPPGSGKSMLARCLASLLPDLSEEESLEVSCIHSAAGLPARTETPRPPLRAPHSSVTVAGMSGGGTVPRPGEMTLAHRGVLFLDELPHFKREVCDLLRGPLESGALVLSRAGRSVHFPARFQWIAAMNPCPCGHAEDARLVCNCSPTEVHRYRAKVGGPILDRIDLRVRVPFVPAEQRVHSSTELRFEHSRGAVERARSLQRARNGGVWNALLEPAALAEVVRLDESARAWLRQRIDRLRLSLRAHHRLLRVARTLADLDGVEQVLRTHLAAALGYRDSEEHAGGSAA